jgi:hypothetical protein
MDGGDIARLGGGRGDRQRAMSACATSSAVLPLERCAGGRDGSASRVLRRRKGRSRGCSAEGLL